MINNIAMTLNRMNDTINQQFYYLLYDSITDREYHIHIMKREATMQTVRLYIMNILIQKGYDSIEEQALNVFTEIFIKYIQNIGIMSKKISDLGNRNSCNMLDVLFASNILNIDIESLYTQKQLKQYNDQTKESKILLANQQQALKNIINELMQSGHKKYNNQEQEQEYQNIQVYEKEFRNKGGVLFEGSRVDQSQNNQQINHLDPHLCQYQNEYYYNQNHLENKILLDEQDIKQIKNQQTKQLNQEISNIKEVSQNQTIRTLEKQQEQFIGNPFGQPQKKIKTLNEYSFEF